MSHLTRAIRFVRHWHARVGVLAALFFVFLALTGLALNHTDGLGLAKSEVRARWLMDWYGLETDIPAQGYLFDQGYLAGITPHWVMDGHDIAAIPEPVVGAVEVAGIRYVATPSMLFLFQPDGSLLEKLTGPALPAAPIHHVGRIGDLLLVQTAQGVFSSRDGIAWNPQEGGTPVWVVPQPLPVDVRRQIAPMFAPALPLERILLDVHSGRIFGRHGPIVMDMAALLLMVLSLSGIWIYLRTIRKKRS